MTSRDRAIACLAFDLWVATGCRPGRDMENWLTAETMLDHLLQVFTVNIRVRQIVVKE